ncbi:hypothetical protein [Streptomyces sp. NBC_01264]|uniref:hypothetical protein n=1 Tax=Streptomyces sp. NBC_01264 TaxID=2903804 RepID=UPI0022509525|nr:hypothetical protein [Streptomyces sp. NBC_01264]MCX4782456.1 hypothetical protein [Streptomyces sp. NBC_01264]
MIRSAGVGALLGGLLVLVVVLPWDLDDFCRSEGWGCLWVFFMLMAAVPVVAALVGWVVLRLVGVRPAWRVAGVGALLGVLAAVLSARAGSWGPWVLFAAPPVLAAAYAVAAAVALPGVGSLRRWGVLAGVLVLLWALAGVLGERQVSGYRERQLAFAQVPLLATELDGYRLYFAEADQYSGTFGYLILPSSVPVGAADRERLGIRVTVAPQLPGFAPPNACEVVSGSTQRDSGPCEQVAPDTWRATTYDSFRYVARRQGVIVVLAGSLTVRKTGFLTT